jgi:hypothetical protein
MIMGTYYRPNGDIVYRFLNVSGSPSVQDTIENTLNKEDMRCIAVIGAVHCMDGEATDAMLNHMESILLPPNMLARHALHTLVVWIFGYIAHPHALNPVVTQKAPRVCIEERRHTWALRFPFARLEYSHIGMNNGSREWLKTTFTSMTGKLTAAIDIKILLTRIIHETAVRIYSKPEDETQHGLSRVVGIVASMYDSTARRMASDDLSREVLAACNTADWETLSDSATFLREQFQHSLASTPVGSADLINPSVQALLNGVTTHLSHLKAERDSQQIIIPQQSSIPSIPIFSLVQFLCLGK